MEWFTGFLFDRSFGVKKYERQIAVFFVVFIVCVLAARFGAIFYDQSSSIVGLLWAPAGIALAFVYLEGYYVGLAVALGVLTAGFLGGIPLFFGLAIAFANGAQAIAGAYLLEQFNFEQRFSRLHDTSVFVAVALLTASVVPSIGVTFGWLYGSSPIAELAISWGRWGPWWLGEFFGMLVLAPVLIRWLPSPSFSRTRREWLEFIALFALLIAIDVFLFWTPFSSFDGIPLVYIILVPLILIAFRVGPRGTTLALLISPVIAILGALALSNAVPVQTFGEKIFQIEVFFSIMSMLFLFFASLAEERKDAVKSLERHVSKLEKAIYKISREDEAKSEFLAILAHELRNPLAPVLSSLELLKLKGVEAEEAPKLIHMMEGRVHTMARLLDDLLDISRISQKKFMLRKERVELAPVVESALATVEPLMASRKHTLTVSVPDIPLYLDADPVRLEQIIVNLLVNAGKYTEPGGVIRLKIAKNASRVSILVSDNGIGIAPEMLSNIFEPFLQVVQGKKSSAGLGIGLFLTRNLVEMHDGYIEARSRGKGTGSEFFVYLPLLRAGNKKALPVQNVPAAFTAGSVSQHTKDKKKLKVLLVDDNESAAVSLGKLLTLSGYEVALAYSGEKALELFPKLRPDAVILDIGLPDIEGYVVAERIRELKAGKDVLLIALTGFGQESDREKARVAGFDHHRTKPIGLAEILPLLKEIPR